MSYGFELSLSKVGFLMLPAGALITIGIGGYENDLGVGSGLGVSSLLNLELAFTRE